MTKTETEYYCTGNPLTTIRRHSYAGSAPVAGSTFYIKTSFFSTRLTLAKEFKNIEGKLCLYKTREEAAAAANRDAKYLDGKIKMSPVFKVAVDGHQPLQFNPETIEIVERRHHGKKYASNTKIEAEYAEVDPDIVTLKSGWIMFPRLDYARESGKEVELDNRSSCCIC